MKTATVRTYHVYGTKNSTCTDVSYREKILKSIAGETPNDSHNKGILWAKSNGFSHIKTIYG